jgi:hypothetical protein
MRVRVLMRAKPALRDRPRVPTVKRAAVSSGMVAFSAPWLIATVLAAAGSQLASATGTLLTLATWIGGVVTGVCWALFVKRARGQGAAIALGTVIGTVLFVLTVFVWSMSVGWD